MKEKIKVAFYYPDAALNDVDCSNLNNGNPGIGGSEYALLLVAERLAQSSDSLAVYLISQSRNDTLPTSNGKLKRLYADSEESLMSVLLSNEIDYVVIRYGVIGADSAFYSQIGYQTKVVLWNENFISKRDRSLFGGLKSVVRSIAVGKEQLDLYLDHSFYKKSDYIYNPIPPGLIESSRNCIVDYLQRPKNVIYMGSLTPSKSFDVLAKAWPQILKMEPEANLYVIGTGQLYGRNQVLGRYGIAEKTYEDEFMPYLCSEDGGILPSVHFCGLMGSEKVEILRNARVGVPNPTGHGETFCIAGVEMQLAGCLVTSKRCPGYLDTFNPDVSMLYDSTEDLAKIVIQLLNRKENHDVFNVINNISIKFDLDKIANEWESLFLQHLPYDTKIHAFVKTNMDYRLKWLKLINKKVKDILPLGYIIFPTVETLFSVFKRIKRCVK